MKINVFFFNRIYGELFDILEVIYVNLIYLSVELDIKINIYVLFYLILNYKIYEVDNEKIFFKCRINNYLRYCNIFS